MDNLTVNPIQGFLQRVSNNQMMQGINQAAGMLQAFQNPVATVLNQSVPDNPELQEVINYIRQNGGDARSAFYLKANQLGVTNTDEVLNKARQIMSSWQKR